MKFTSWPGYALPQSLPRRKNRSLEDAALVAAVVAIALLACSCVCVCAWAGAWACVAGMLVWLRAAAVGRTTAGRATTGWVVGGSVGTAGSGVGGGGGGGGVTVGSSSSSSSSLWCELGLLTDVLVFD